MNLLEIFGYINMKTISQAAKTLMIDAPYYGLFLCGLNKYFSDHVPTAGVCLEGINYQLLINKDYWNKITSVDQRASLLQHELLHICLFHLEHHDQYIVLADNNHYLCNLAEDLIVQSYIPTKRLIKIDGKFASLADQIFNDFPNLSKGCSYKYYIDFLKNLKNKLNKDNNENKSSNSGKRNNKGNSEKDDLGNQWLNDDYDKLSNEEKETLRDNLNNNPEDLHESWAKIFQDMSDDKKELIRSQIEYQMKEAAQNVQRGLWPGELNEKLDSLLKPKPPVFNWKNYFRRCLGVSFDIYMKKTRRKESKRFPDNPGLNRKKKHKILVGIDTSGSVNSKEFLDFFSEINHIYKAGADIHILECDTNISAEYDYKGKTPNQIHGRGGTSFLPVVEWYNNHSKDYTCCVYFTDGYGDQNLCKPNGKMLWVITSEGNQESEYPGIKICIPKQIKS